jgi:hypothetical protein
VSLGLGAQAVVRWWRRDSGLQGALPHGSDKGLARPINIDGLPEHVLQEISDRECPAADRS